MANKLPAPAKEAGASRMHRLTPVIAGMLVDLIDFATFGPLGLYGGLLVGGLASYLIFKLYGVPRKQRLLLALVAGIYCTTPMTEFIPLGTVIGAVYSLRSASAPERTA